MDYKGYIWAIYAEYFEGKGGNYKPDAQYAEVSAKSPRVTRFVILVLLVETHNDFYLGPKNLSPFKWIMWSGISATHTSVSHANCSENFL